jgi:hypothetical protein
MWSAARGGQVPEVRMLEMRRWIPLEVVSKGQRNHHGRLAELVVTSKVLRVYMAWR